MPEHRSYDVTGLTDAELERAKRDLQVSLALAMPGSPVTMPIQTRLSAIDAELHVRTTHQGANP